MNQIQKSLSLLAILVMAIIVTPGCQTAPDDTKQVKYVFYMIGDGMGLAQSSVTEAYLSANQNVIGFSKLRMSEMPVQSYMTTYSEDDFITCSAASGTALATGMKTSNGTVSLASNHRDTLTTIAEIAKSNGMKVGIVSSVSLDHATPAVFYAHQPSRNSYYEIGLQMVKSNFDFFGGGGLKDPDGKGYDDRNNLIEIAEENGYTFVNSREDFENLSPGTGKVLAINPVLASGSSIPYAIDQDDQTIPLADFTSKAIEMLDNENGFFLMVEGGKIDWSCHNNDAATTIHEVLDFDRAVGVVLDFYREHPEETLVVVFADHETGGMSLGSDGMDHENAYGLLSAQKASIDVFTEVLNSYFESLQNKKAGFDEVMKLVTEYFGLGAGDLQLNEMEREYLLQAFNNRVEGRTNDGDVKSLYMYGSRDPVAVTAAKMLARKAGIGWTSFSHTAIPVPVRAMGHGQEKFAGYIDNSDIPVITLEILGF